MDPYSKTIPIEQLSVDSFVQDADLQAVAQQLGVRLYFYGGQLAFCLDPSVRSQVFLCFYDC